MSSNNKKLPKLKLKKLLKKNKTLLLILLLIILIVSIVVVVVVEVKKNKNSKSKKQTDSNLIPKRGQGKVFETSEELHQALLIVAYVKPKYSASSVPEKLPGYDNVLRTYGNPEDWNISKLTSLSGVMKDLGPETGKALNKIDFSAWDTSNVNDMSYMLYNNVDFNNPTIKNWDTSRVTNMSYCFATCSKFNQPLEWVTDNVVNMKGIFKDCAELEKGIVYTMYYWNTVNVIDMSEAFSGCTKINDVFRDWEVMNVRNMDNMFRGAKSFLRDITNWNVHNVLSAKNMFLDCPMSLPENKDLLPKFKPGVLS